MGLTDYYIFICNISLFEKKNTQSEVKTTQNYMRKEHKGNWSIKLHHLNM